MSADNKIVICVLLVICALLTYRVSTGHPALIENFWGTLPSFIAQTDVVNNQGFSVPKNNQSQLYVNANPLINTSILSNNDKQLLADSLSSPSSPAFQSYLSQIHSPNAQTNPIDTTEYYKDPLQDGPPVFTVPGNYQSLLSPRFSADGYRSYVKYDLPAEPYMANRPDDPLMMAHRVEKQRENYEPSFQGQSVQTQTQMYDQLKNQGDEVVSKLPIASMNMMNVNEKPDIYWNTDRFIFALQKNRLYAHGDPIRGDVPCVPCNPSSDPQSNVWFRPSVTPANALRTGAINVIAGVGNVTSQQTAELQMRATGGTKDTFGGVALNIPTNTPVANLQALKNSEYLNMGNSIQMQVDHVNPPSFVQTTTFP